MKTTVSQFKCDLCGSIAIGIPYCGSCETALSNSTKIGEVITVVPYAKPVRVVKKKVFKPKAIDEDFDLVSHPENIKASLIHSMIYSRKRRK
jgi:hypothetical protein